MVFWNDILIITNKKYWKDIQCMFQPSFISYDCSVLLLRHGGIAFDFQVDCKISLA